MCLAEERLTEKQAAQFQQLGEQLQASLHQHFHSRQEALKEAYLAVNPQARLLDSGLLTESQEDLKVLLAELLEQANYEPVTEADLAAALEEASLFKVRLQVDFSRFEEVLLYSRGQSQRTESLKLLWGLYRKTVTFTHYDNVALYLKVPPEEGEEGAGERVYLKLFENVPKADIEMLFPETQVRMRNIDKLLIGVPALVGGGVMLTTKLGATLLLIGSLLGFWLGMHAEPVTLDKAALLALLAGLGTLAGFIWKQVKNFRTRKLQFVQALTRNLYFKNVANNASVIYQLVDEAEEEECKEILLAYYFLLTSRCRQKRWTNRSNTGFCSVGSIGWILKSAMRWPSWNDWGWPGAITTMTGRLARWNRRWRWWPEYAGSFQRLLNSQGSSTGCFSSTIWTAGMRVSKPGKSGAIGHIKGLAG